MYIPKRHLALIDLENIFPATPNFNYAEHLYVYDLKKYYLTAFSVIMIVTE
jgi:hypothetical protein